MRASNWLILITTVLYLGVSIASLYEGDKAKAVVFAGYALANLGFILS